MSHNVVEKRREGKWRSPERKIFKERRIIPRSLVWLSFLLSENPLPDRIEQNNNNAIISMAS